jgi:chromosome segregation ATPase
MQPRTGRRRIPLAAAGAAAALALLLGGCGAAQEQLEQGLEQGVGAVAESARAEAERLLDEATSTLPDAAQVSEENQAAFAELRGQLEAVEEQVTAVLAAPEDLSAAALAPLQEQLTQLEASVQERAAELTGVSVTEQEAWAELARSAGRAADQLGAVASLLG